MISEVTSQQHWQAEEYHCNSSIQNEAARQLLQYIQFKGAEKILDVGCGDGKITAGIASYVPRGFVIGIDTSIEMIHFAQRLFSPDCYGNLLFVHQDAQQLNYSEEFDVIFSSFALQWVLDQDSFLKKAYLGLKPIGHFVATIPLGISQPLEQSIDEIISLPEWSSYFKGFSKNWHFTDENEFAQLLTMNKFVPIRLDVIPVKKIFSSRETFEKYVIQWFPYLRILPEHLKLRFFEQIIDKYLEIEPPLKNGEVCFNFSRLDIIASKVMF